MAQDIVLSGIISYPHLFTPQQINGKGDPKFSCTLILDANTDWGAANTALQEALATKFGNAVPQHYKQPFQDASGDGFPGQFKINLYSDADKPPQVMNQAVQPLLDPAAIFAGCKVNVYLRLYGYSTSGNNGVGCGLNAVQLVDNVNVTRLDNRVDAKNVFQSVPGAPAQLAPTAYSQPQGQAPGFPQQQQPGIPPGAPQATPPQQQGYAPNPAAPPAGYPAAPPGPPAGAPPAAGYPSSQGGPAAAPGGPVPPGAPGQMPWMQ